MSAQGGRRPWPLEVRQELVARVDAGEPCSRVADELGVSRSAAHVWVTDPDGTRLRERKRRYDMECVECGGWVSGHSGKRDKPRCVACGSEASAVTRTVWTRELLIERIREWARLYGDPPAVPDWMPAKARDLNDPERAERYIAAAGHWPPVGAVFRRFDSWNAALEQAGFTPRSPHGGGGNELRKRAVRGVAA